MTFIRRVVPYLLCMAASSGLTVVALVYWPFSEEAAPQEVPDAIQAGVAIHEAGHAIADAYLIDSRLVKSVSVWTKLKGKRYYGLTDEFDPVGFSTAPQLLRNAATFCAGRAADELISGAADDGATSDMQEATKIIRKMHLEKALGASLVAVEDAYADDEDMAIIESDVNRVCACAGAIVSANESLVRVVATAIMGKTPVSDERHLTGAEFRAIIGELPILPPKVSPPLVDDPCAF